MIGAVCTRCASEMIFQALSDAAYRLFIYKYVRHDEKKTVEIFWKLHFVLGIVQLMLKY